MNKSKLKSIIKECVREVLTERKKMHPRDAVDTFVQGLIDHKEYLLLRIKLFQNILGTPEISPVLVTYWEKQGGAAMIFTKMKDIDGYIKLILKKKKGLEPHAASSLNQVVKELQAAKKTIGVIVKKQSKSNESTVKEAKARTEEQVFRSSVVAAAFDWWDSFLDMKKVNTHGMKQHAKLLEKMFGGKIREWEKKISEHGISLYQMAQKHSKQYHGVSDMADAKSSLMKFSKEYLKGKIGPKI